MTFHGGQKVVCINDGYECFDQEKGPKKGGIYTVRSVEAGRKDPNKSFITLIEIVNPIQYYGLKLGEVLFDSDGFIPLDERKTDISIFLNMLTTVHGE